MRGTLIYVMGPSGSGKDSLLSALRPRLRGLPVAFARRYISRPACAGGEQHMALSAGSILSMEAQGLEQSRLPVRHRPLHRRQPGARHLRDRQRFTGIPAGSPAALS